eukprot:318126_1
MENLIKEFALLDNQRQHNYQHLIVYGYIGRSWLITNEIKMIIYQFYTFWDSSMTDDIMMINNNNVENMSTLRDWYNAFSVRFTTECAKWKFKVVKCGQPNCWGVLGITQDNKASKNLGAWFMKSKNKFILLWTGMSFIFNAGEYIQMKKNDWNVNVGDTYTCEVNLKSRVVIFEKNDIVLKIIENINIQNGYRIAIAFNTNDAIEMIPI